MRGAYEVKIIPSIKLLEGFVSDGFHRVNLLPLLMSFTLLSTLHEELGTVLPVKYSTEPILTNFKRLLKIGNALGLYSHCYKHYS